MLGAEALRMSFRSLWNHKMRSLLTIMGVVIGVGSVIAVVSLGAAFEASITGQFDDIDDRSIFVTAGQDEGVANGPPDAGQFGLVFTEVDRQALLGIDGVDRVIAAGQVPVTNLRHDGRDLQFRTLSATTQDADEVRNAGDYLIGGPFTDGENEMVLGFSIAQQLSGVKGDTEPTMAVGASVVVTLPDASTKTVTLTGILAKQESLFGTNNGLVYVPVDPFYSAERQSPSTGENVRVYDGFTVIAGRDRPIDDIKADVTSYMENRSDAGRLLDEIDGFGVLVATASDITKQISGAFDQITLFIAAIAATSLLVGGIMIGTIMLISVTERTREIGIMKAIGGLDRDVMWLFLFEAAIIGLVGSLLGIALGFGLGFALVEGLFGGEDVSFIVPWNWVAISVAVGVLTGIFAGFFPARRATKIQPVQALSYE